MGYEYSSDEKFSNTLITEVVKEENSYSSRRSSNKNFAYKLRLSKNFNNNKLYLDESLYQSRIKQVYSLGRISRWWSYSKNTSLILSNNARPSPGISIENYEPIKVNISF